MRYATNRVVIPLMAIASVISLPHGAIAHPASIPSPSRATLNRLARDLIPSAAEQFFKEGQKRLERDLQQLTTHRQVLPEDLLQVIPDPRSLSDEIEKLQTNPQQTPNQSPTPKGLTEK